MSVRYSNVCRGFVPPRMGRKRAAARPPNRWTGGFASMLFSALPLAAAAVELRVAGIEVPGVERILHLAETFTETGRYK